LEAGMILSNEPGYYENGEYGIRIENLMLIKDVGDGFLGFETLTLAPIDLRLINFKMITYPERKWLKEYHENIFEKLKGGISDDERKWLEGVVSEFSLKSK
jgi:Xaa-Pro aminopeptidase